MEKQLQHTKIVIMFSLMMSTLAISIFQPRPVFALGKDANTGVVALSATTWYVTTTGDDSNSCTSIATPCLTINGTIAKTADGDTIEIATGIYTGLGSQVMLINKSVTLSGGWDETFTTQDGMSTVDGQTARRGVIVNNGVITTINHFVVQNGFFNLGSTGGGGIFNNGTLTMNNSVIRNNATDNYSSGGGIYNTSTMTLNNSTITDNSTHDKNGGGGIYNYNTGTITLNNSNISENSAGTYSGGGIFTDYFSHTTLNNTTVNNNIAGGGAGIYNASGTLIINSSTITRNTALSGGGIDSTGGSVTIQNSILAGNIGNWPDCVFPPTSAGYNIIGDATSCNFSPTTGDLINVDPKIGLFIGNPGYYPLSSNSPAINAGNPAGCTGSAGILTTDQRGATRVGRCDIGAYEYTTPGAATSIFIASGNDQSTAPTLTFSDPLQVVALDTLGSPVSNVNVTFTAPNSGASGTFSSTGTNTTSVLTDDSGTATTATFIANDQFGVYTISASASGAAAVNFDFENAAWYVATTGNDSNTCTNSGNPCATINVAISKASKGGAILVAAGTYTDTGTQVVTASKSIKLFGGWDATFTTQSNASIIDGQATRRGLMVNRNTTVTIDHFVIQNGKVVGNAAGGIWNDGTLTINYSTIQQNISGGEGGGIFNLGTLSLNNSIVTGNIGGGGAGIANGSYSNNIQVTMTVNNSTISNNNTGSSGGSGLKNSASGRLYLNNVTVSQNTSSSSFSSGIGNAEGGVVTLQNTILAGNTEPGLVGGKIVPVASDCSGDITSYGYNLIGNNTLSYCTFHATTGDKVGTDAHPIDPRLGPVQNNGGPTFTRALLVGSPALNAGNPATPGSTAKACQTTDQRGANRPYGSACDIGAFEITSTFTVSEPIAPASTISDTTPTYQWYKLPAATQYRYQVFKGPTLVFTQIVPVSVCGASTCLNTPKNVVNNAVYKWKVQALIGGVWKSYSIYKTFTIAAPKAGTWKGTGLEFYVTSNQATVDNFAVYISVQGCGIYKITHSPLAAIVNKKFSFASSFYANGTFDTLTGASGVLGLKKFLIPGCGVVSGGPFYWKATWRNASQPTISTEADVASILIEPELDTAENGSYTIELVNP